MSTESESASPSHNVEKCSLVLVDVAGTTTSIDFVKDTLFPFVLKQVEPFLKAKWSEESIKECIEQLKETDDLDIAAAVEKVKTLTQEESNNKGLKTLQGLIYKEGYEKGDLKGHIFDDVSEALESWSKNRRIAVYSTGSVDSQKLLFSHTVRGDVSAHIHKYFDQTVGPKTAAESYKAIAKEVQVAPEEVVFITDDYKEATAAKDGGVNAILIKRDGNAALPEEAAKEFTVISSFKDLGFDKAPKRKIEDEAAAEEAPPAKVAKTDASQETGKPQKETEEKKPEVEQTEAMEVDAPVEKEAETSKKSVEETDKVAASETAAEPEKTESETKEKATADTEVKADSKVADEKMDVVEETKKVEEEKKETATEEVKATTEANKESKETKQTEEKPVKEAKQKEETKKSTTGEAQKPEVVEEKKVVEEATKATATTKETKVEEKESKEATDNKAETKVEETTNKVETKVEETGDKVESKVVETEQTTDSKVEPEKKVEAKVEETEKKVEETEKKVEAKIEETGKKEAKETEKKPESKVDETEAKVEAADEAKEAKPEEKPVENGEKSESIEPESSPTKAEEKENKSVLANGKAEVSDAGVSAELSLDAEKADESEMKVKKLEESAESKTVSVEV